jgi:hypothetical protein
MRLGKEQAAGYVEDTAGYVEDTEADSLPVAEVEAGQAGGMGLATAPEPSLTVT